MDKIKVCHFTCAHEATDVRVFQKECVSLAKEGYEVYLVVPDAKTEIKEGVQIIGVPIKSRNPIYRLFHTSGLVYKKALEIGADIYHFHDIELFSHGVKLKRKGYKVIFDSHEDWLGYIKAITWLPSVVRKLTGGYLTWQYRKNLSKFDAVLTVSPHIVESLKEYSDRVSMVSNYPIVNEDLLTEPDEQKYMARDNKVCYAGTVYENSNQEAIIRALEEIDDIQYALVGTISTEYKKRLSLLPGWSKVHFIQHVPFDELKSIYRSTLAGLVVLDYMPNCGYKKGSLGVNKIYEYMLMGLPVICTDYEIWKELIIDKYKCGFCVSPGNVEEIRSAILYIIKNKEIAFQMGQMGRNAVMMELNWKSQESILLGIYKELLYEDK